MWVLLVLSSATMALAVSSNYYCADMSPQPHVNVEQLMGMWFGIEIINHNPDQEHYVRVAPSCPIIHISEDKSYTTPPPYNPLHKDYNYGYNYGERRNNYGTQRPYQERNHQKQQHYPYNRDRTYGRNGYTTNSYNQNPTPSYNNRKYGDATDWTKQYPEELKHLRVWWDEHGTGTEYQALYNVTAPGFWKSLGPNNGSQLDPLYSHFAGTIQVFKAVGNHLVLNFCHQLPQRQLFTILLARENKLDQVDIHGVHTLLHRRGLSTNSINKVCFNSGNRPVRLGMSTLLILVVGMVKAVRIEAD